MLPVVAAAPLAVLSVKPVVPPTVNDAPEFKSTDTGCASTELEPMTNQLPPLPPGLVIRFTVCGAAPVIAEANVSLLPAEPTFAVLPVPEFKIIVGANIVVVPLASACVMLLPAPIAFSVKDVPASARAPASKKMFPLAVTTN